MDTSRLKYLTMAAALLLARARTASATDGHFLHGVGAVNSAMGGVAVARASSILGAFYTNPAGLADCAGTSVEIGFELFLPDRTVTSSFGSSSGSTTSSSDSLRFRRSVGADRLTVTAS